MSGESFHYGSGLMNEVLNVTHSPYTEKNDFLSVNFN